MNTYEIYDFELGATVPARAQGVAEAMFDYLPWPTFDAKVTFRSNEGWTVIDNQTDFMYLVTTPTIRSR